MRDVILYAGERAGKRMRSAILVAIAEWAKDNGYVFTQSEENDLMERIRKAMRELVLPPKVEAKKPHDEGDIISGCFGN